MVLTTQDQALAAMRRGENCNLTGQAGVGKSSVVRRFCEESREPVCVTASSGVAALNVRGRTLHSFCGMGLGPNPGQPHDDFIEFLEKRPGFFRARQRIESCRTLVIDEISMLTGATLDFVDDLFRQVRQDRRPFGGVQLIVSGDFCQLPPVRKGEAAYDWAFESRAWRDAAFTDICLQRIWRQDEPDFIRCLNDFRGGALSRESERLLRGRVIDFPDDEIPRLFTHNRQVDKWNRQMLDRLPGADVVIPAILRGPQHQIEFMCRNLITPDVLTLREGARVMMTANLNDSDGDRVFVNGQMGTITHISTGFGVAVTVQLDDGSTIRLDRQTWHYDWQDPQSASFTQFPIKLAYGMTIHKSQGLTLQKGLIDIRAAREPGQAYVALSRMRSLAGVYLKAWFNGFMVSQKALQFYASLG